MKNNTGYSWLQYMNEKKEKDANLLELEQKIFNYKKELNWLQDKINKLEKEKTLIQNKK
jgi:hypothetical protein